jgi:signal transduction histidine kinase
LLAALRVLSDVHAALWATGVASVAFTLLGLVAFNLGYVWLYVAFLPLLCISSFLSAEVHVDLFLALLLFAVASTLLYAVGIFALPLVACGIILSVPLLLLFQKRKIISSAAPLEQGYHFWGRKLELCELLLIALFARYALYRAGGGTIPLRIGEFESLSRFLISEIGGWGVFAVGYGMQLRGRYGTLYSAEAEFVTSLPALLATGLFLVSPHVAIMTLGLNLFDITGLYVGSLPVGAAHLLMRTLTWRRLAIEGQNQRLQLMNVELARSERLAAIGQMSSAISHQLLQKVGLVGLQSSLLRDVLLDDSTPTEERLREGRERVEQLDESIADLNTTLSDLLIFSKDVALHLNPCLLSPLLREAADEARAMAATRGVAVVLRGETEGAPVLLVDRIKLKQALLNLLTNAVEASPTDGRVDLELREERDYIQIHVSDQGTGVPDSDLERIFSPYFSTKAQGTGLGLTFAQKIVALHGGTVSVNNSPQGGASFVIELPRQPTQEA